MCFICECLFLKYLLQSFICFIFFYFYTFIHTIYWISLYSQILIQLRSARSAPKILKIVFGDSTQHKFSYVDDRYFVTVYI